ncbi:MAG: 4Fe-4S binding protein [Chloroflexia bacterium]|nr:4Fe-4S binding protein [Chloroflexia bacterium]
MAKVKGTIVVDVEKCKGCELCVVACPTNVIRLASDVNGKGYHFAYMETPEACTGCTNCALVCPDSVITVYRLKPQKEEVSA